MLLKFPWYWYRNVGAVFALARKLHAFEAGQVNDPVAERSIAVKLGLVEL
jgi:hypothetical protein